MDKYLSCISRGPEAYLEVLNEINWFKYSDLPEDKVKKRLLEAKDLVDYQLSLYELWFDAEGFEDDESYKSLLEEILKIVSLPLTLNVEYIKATNTVEINIQGKENSYYYSIQMKSDWVDEDLIDFFINKQVLPNENVENRFYALPPSDQTVQFVFVPEEIFQLAIERGIVPEDMGYFMG